MYLCMCEVGFWVELGHEASTQAQSNLGFSTQTCTFSGWVWDGLGSPSYNPPSYNPT